MLTLDQERILLIGDRDRGVGAALAQVLPGAQVHSVASYFDALAELASGGYTTILASAEPIERRPEAAVKALRDVAGDGRIVLFGHPTLEPLSRKMLEFGGDDYIVTPISPTEMQQMFGAAPLRLGPGAGSAAATDGAKAAQAGEVSTDGAFATAPRIAILNGLPLAEIVLDAMMHHPHDAPATAIRQINARIGPTLKLVLTSAAQPAPQPGEGMRLLSHLIRYDGGNDGTLHLLLPRDEDEAAARHVLAQLCTLVGKLLSLHDRHARLQRLAITDDLTGLYNGRYFRHFLETMLARAREKKFPVTLLLFDIDNFKSYNDRYGHPVGDEILRQTAALMRRCTRPHDLVARISGDEFAVVFWEKEGPRQRFASGAGPEPAAGPTPGVSLYSPGVNVAGVSVSAGTARVPPTVRAVCDRFRRLISSPDFQVLGTTGQGTLTISGGIAVYPYDAQDAHSLIEAADRALMFDAKKGGKNSIFLVGDGHTSQGL